MGVLTGEKTFDIAGGDIKKIMSLKKLNDV
jgi:hypothetical protein